MIKKIHHIGFAARDLKKTLEFFKTTLGARVIWQARIEEQKIESILIAMGSARIELLGSLDPQSLIAKFLKTKGEGMHHTSLEVSDFDQTIAEFKDRGLKVVAKTDTDDFKAAFIHPESMSGMLTEIIEPKGNWAQ